MQKYASSQAPLHKVRENNVFGFKTRVLTCFWPLVASTPRVFKCFGPWGGVAVAAARAPLPSIRCMITPEKPALKGAGSLPLYRREAIHDPDPPGGAHKLPWGANFDFGEGRGLSKFSLRIKSLRSPQFHSCALERCRTLKALRPPGRLFYVPKTYVWPRAVYIYIYILRS